jgi:phage-related protein
MKQKKKRTQEEIVIEAFRMMMQLGELTLKEVEVPLQTGGTFTKKLYKVEPMKRRQ